MAAGRLAGHRGRLGLPSRCLGQGLCDRGLRRRDRLGVRRLGWSEVIHRIAPDQHRFAGRRAAPGIDATAGPGKLPPPLDAHADRYLGPDARGMARRTGSASHDHRPRLLAFRQLPQGAVAARTTRTATIAGSKSTAARARRARRNTWRRTRTARCRCSNSTTAASWSSRTRSCASWPKARPSCPAIAGSARRRWAGCSSSSTATSRTSRSRASSAAGRRSIRRAARPNCRAARTRPPGAGGDGAASRRRTTGSPAPATASPTSRCSPTPTSRTTAASISRRIRRSAPGWRACAPRRDSWRCRRRRRRTSRCWRCPIHDSSIACHPERASIRDRKTDPSLRSG